jgi:mono/diheme cytochrome c family protein
MKLRRLLALICFALMAGSVCVMAQDAKAPEWKAPARAAKRKNPVPADAKSVAAGKEIYAAQCISCHGATGGGDGPKAADLQTKPRNLREPKIQAQTDGELFWKLTTGKTPMPVFEKLLPDENDRWTVINYVRTFAPASTTQPTTPATTQP